MHLANVAARDLALSEYRVRTLPRSDAASWWAATDTGPTRAPVPAAQISEVECALCLAAWKPGAPAIWSLQAPVALRYLWPRLIDHLAHIHGVRPEPTECP